MTMLMLARRAREQEAVFRRRGLGEPFGIQLGGKRLGIVGMGNIGMQLHPLLLMICYPHNAIDSPSWELSHTQRLGWPSSTHTMLQPAQQAAVHSSGRLEKLALAADACLNLRGQASCQVMAIHLSRRECSHVLQGPQLKPILCGNSGPGLTGMLLAAARVSIWGHRHNLTNLWAFRRAAGKGC